MTFEKKFKIEIGFGMRLRKDGSAIGALEANQALREIEACVSRIAGGCTTVRSHGTWVSPTGQSFVEDGACVFFFLPTLWPATIGNAVDYIKATLDQEAVAVTVTEVDFCIT